MSGRRKRSSSASGFGDLIRTVILILLLLIGLLLFVSGFLLLVLWPVFFLYKYLKMASKENGILTVEEAPQSFWLNMEEKFSFRNTFEKLTDAKKSLEQHIDVLNSLPEARLNKNGSYDQRSQAGRDRGEQQAKVDLIESQIFAYERELSLLSRAPTERFFAWVDRIVKYKSTEFTLFFIVLGIPVYEFIVLAILGYPSDAPLAAYVFYSLTAPLQVLDGLFSIKDYLPFFFAPEFTGFVFNWKHWVAVMVVPPFLTIIPHIMYPPFYKNRLERRAIAPPEVNIENIDAYSS